MNSNPSSASSTPVNAASTSNRSELIQKYYSQLNTGLERIRLHLGNPNTPADRLPWLQQKQAELNKQLAVFKEKYMSPNSASPGHVVATHLGPSLPQATTVVTGAPTLQQRPGPLVPTHVSAPPARPFAIPPQTASSQPPSLSLTQAQAQAQAQAQTGARPPHPPPSSIVSPPRPALNYAATSAAHLTSGHRRIPSAASMPLAASMQQPNTPMSPVGRPPNAPPAVSQAHPGLVRPLNQMMVNVGSLAHAANVVGSATASSFVRLPPGGGTAPLPSQVVNPSHVSAVTGPPPPPSHQQSQSQSQPQPPHMRAPPSAMGPAMMMVGQRPGMSAAGDSASGSTPGQGSVSAPSTMASTAAAAAMRGGPFAAPSAAMYYNSMAGPPQQTSMYTPTTTGPHPPPPSSSGPVPSTQPPGAGAVTPSKSLAQPASIKSTPKGKGVKKKTAAAVAAGTSGPSSAASTVGAGMDVSQLQMQTQASTQMSIHSQMQAQAQAQNMQRLGHVRTNSGGATMAGAGLFMSHPMYGGMPSGPSAMSMHPHSVTQLGMSGSMQGTNVVSAAVPSSNVGTMTAVAATTAPSGAPNVMPSSASGTQSLIGMVNRFAGSGAASSTLTPSQTASGSYSDLKRPFSANAAHAPSSMPHSQPHAPLRHTSLLQPVPVSGKPLAHLLMGSKMNEGGPHCFSPRSEKALLALADDFVERLAYTACYAAYLRTSHQRDDERDKGEPHEGCRLEYADVAYALDHSLGMYLPPPPPPSQSQPQPLSSLSSRSIKDLAKETGHHRSLSLLKRRQMPSLPLKPYRTGRLHKRAFHTSSLSGGGHLAGNHAKKDDKKKNPRKKPNATSKKKLPKEAENDMTATATTTAATTALLDNDMMDVDSEDGIDEL